MEETRALTASAKDKQGGTLPSPSRRKHPQTPPQRLRRLISKALWIGSLQATAFPIEMTEQFSKMTRGYFLPNLRVIIATYKASHARYEPRRPAAAHYWPRWGSVLHARPL